MNLQHGHSWRGGYSPTYGSWKAMRERCKPDGKYGLKGITVCERWQQSFGNFLADMGVRPDGATLDRYPDRNGNYEPGNCRWATWDMQVANSDRRVPHKGAGSKKCEPGCTCGRHALKTHSWSAGRKCQDGCTCGRHREALK